MTVEATAPAVATTAAPAVEAPKTAPVVDSLIPPNDTGTAAPKEATTTPVAEAKSPAPEAAKTEWFYADGTPGKGEMPAWYKADRYKTVEAQAEAYAHLEKRFGAFKGAPADGKYEFKMPEGLGVELVNDHPLLGEFQKWAAESQLSQEGYQHLIGMLAQYEAAQLVDMNEVKKELGDKADDRINSIFGWARANLDETQFQALRVATSGKTAAAAFQVIEAAISKTRQVPMPKPGEDVISAQPLGEDKIKAMMEARDSDGRLKYMVDSEYRKKVEAANLAYHQSLQRA